MQTPSRGFAYYQNRKIRVNNWLRVFLLDFSSAYRRHRSLYALAFAALLLAAIVGKFTGNRPDFHVLWSFGAYLAIAFRIAICGYAVYRLARLALVQRNPAPGRAMLGAFVAQLSDSGRLANGMHGLGAFIVFCSGFAVLKGAIAVLHPFAWDLALAKLDAALHFGRAPH